MWKKREFKTPLITYNPYGGTDIGDTKQKDPVKKRKQLGGNIRRDKGVSGCTVSREGN